MNRKRRIFVSFVNPEILDPRRMEIQKAVIKKIENQGFEPEMFFHKGSAAYLSWSFQNLIEIMGRCVGAVVIAFPRWEIEEEEGARMRIVSEYAQIEGAIATVLNLPLFIMAERGVADRGVTWTGAGHPIHYIPTDANADWVENSAFLQRFGIWNDQVSQRSDVFLGYSSKARNTAMSVLAFLRDRLGIKVRNWEIDFAAAGIIIDEIETASKVCSGGIFLFTKDDQLEGNEMKAAPRDNVVFEAGFFTAAKGRDKVLIILEEGAKMPADLGGNIYLSLQAREDIRPIESAIRDFIEKRI